MAVKVWKGVPRPRRVIHRAASSLCGTVGRAEFVALRMPSERSRSSCVTMKNVLSLPRLPLPQKAFGQRRTYRTVSPCFQAKLCLWRWCPKVCGWACKKSPVVSIIGAEGLEQVLCTGPVATFHESTHPCTSLWIRPVDNSAHGVVRSPGPTLQRASVSCPPVSGCAARRARRAMP